MDRLPIPTKVAAFAAKLAEGCWLASLVVVPVFFNRYSQRVFEEDKSLLLRSIALVLCAALVVWCSEQGRGGFGAAVRRLRRAPLVAPVLLLGAAFLLSNVFSVAPAVSFWGAYIRCQGTYTWLSYVAIFFAILLLARRREAIERAVTVALLVSVPIAVYAFIEHLGGDPIPWSGGTMERVSSTAGNPIFFSAYMIMVVPLTLARVIEAGARLFDASADAPRRRWPFPLLAGAYAVLLVLQLLTIVFSESRGPVIGLGVALPLFFVILGVRYRLRWLVLTVTGATVAGVLFLVVMNVRHSPLWRLHKLQYVGHLGEIFQADSGTGKVRVLIWEGATALLAADPVRDLVGYGPETMRLVYSRVYPPELGDYEDRDALPDRAHNETFDTLIMLGVLGFAAQLLVFLSLFYYVLRWLGMIQTKTQRDVFIVTVVAGGVLGGIVPYLIDGRARFSGVGLPVGIAGALIAYLIGLDFRRSDSIRVRSRRDGLLLLALFTAAVAHFVEIHFGIAVVATRLYFWVYAALAVAVGAPLIDDASAETGVSNLASSRSPQFDASAAVAGPTGSLLDLSPVVGLTLAALTFDFYVPASPKELHAGALLTIFLSLWLFGAFAIATEAMPDTLARGDLRQRLATYATTSLGVWLLFLAAHVAWAGWVPRGDRSSVEVANQIAAHLANTVSLFYVYVLVAILCTAAVAYLRDPPPGPLAFASGRRAALYPLALCVAIYVAVLTNLARVRVDCLAKLASSYEGHAQWEPARALYEEAQRRAPSVERYAISSAHLLMEAGRASSDVAEHDAYFGDALRVIERSRQSDPLNMDHVRNLARLYRLWASMTDDPTLRARRYAEAEAAYGETMHLSPNHVAVMNEWATLYLDRNEPAKAIAKFAESLEIDDHYANTYWLRGNAYAAAGNLEEALHDYDRAVDIDHWFADAWSSEAAVLSRLQRLPEAIVAGRRAVALNPDDVAAQNRLALLYRQAGQYDLAIAQAQTALRVAKETQRPALEALIEQLNEERGAQPSDNDGS